MAGPVVDTGSAQEFSREIGEQITLAELAEIAERLERKSAAMRGILLAAGQPDRAALREVLRLVFATRRKADLILDATGPDQLARAIADLLDHDRDLAIRFDRFDALLSGLPPAVADLPAELLHFTFPGQYWLWTRWLWDPRTRTGALALVTSDDAAFSLPDPDHGSRGQAYLTVGRATAFVNETGKAAGFTDAAPGLFGTDMFLAAVYGVYMYTVLRMRMTREFNQLVPQLPDLIRRLLGIYYTPREASDAHRRA